MKNELEKRQREDDSTKANQSTQPSEASENGCDSTAAITNGIDTAPTNLVTC